MDIYDNTKRIESLWKLSEKNCIKENIDLMKKMEQEMKANGLSESRILFYLNPIYIIAKEYKEDLSKAGKDEIKHIVSSIEGKDYTEWTKVRYKQSLRKFFQVIAGIEWKSKKYPEIVDWFNTTVRKNRLKNPIILSKEEVLTLFQVAKGIREKAMVSFMYESGCRCPDELLHMKIRDVEFDEHGAKIKLTSGKVGTRTIRVISCVPHLKNWLDKEHPNPKNDSYLWVNKGTKNHGEVMAYQTLHLMVKRWGREAKLDKVITPYTFRRTRYTHLSTKMPTPLLYKYMGQVQGSRVIERYVNLNEEAVDDAILSFHGIKPKENGDIKAVYCSRCTKQNPPELDYCEVCHGALTEKAVLEAGRKQKEELFNELVERFKEELRGDVSGTTNKQ